MRAPARVKSVRVVAVCACLPHSYHERVCSDGVGILVLAPPVPVATVSVFACLPNTCHKHACSDTVGVCMFA